jgi:hypothetical protein
MPSCGGSGVRAEQAVGQTLRCRGRPWPTALTHAARNETIGHSSRSHSNYGRAGAHDTTVGCSTGRRLCSGASSLSQRPVVVGVGGSKRLPVSGGGPLRPKRRPRARHTSVPLEWRGCRPCRFSLRGLPDRATAHRCLPRCRAAGHTFRAGDAGPRRSESHRHTVLEVIHRSGREGKGPRVDHQRRPRVPTFSDDASSAASLATCRILPNPAASVAGVRPAGPLGTLRGEASRSPPFHVKRRPEYASFGAARTEEGVRASRAPATGARGSCAHSGPPGKRVAPSLVH